MIKFQTWAKGSKHKKNPNESEDEHLKILGGFRYRLLKDFGNFGKDEKKRKFAASISNENLKGALPNLFYD